MRRNTITIVLPAGKEPSITRLRAAVTREGETTYHKIVEAVPGHLRTEVTGNIRYWELVFEHESEVIHERELDRLLQLDMQGGHVCNPPDYVATLERLYSHDGESFWI